MSNPPGEYYTEERWQNWLDRIREKDIDPEDEDSARLLLNLQDDTAIAVAKIITDHDDGELDRETALAELEDIEGVVLDEVDIADEETAMLIDGDELDMATVEDLDFGLVAEWVNGLDSLQTAMSDPEVVEEEDE